MKYPLFLLVLFIQVVFFSSDCLSQQLGDKAKTAYENGALFKAKELCSQYISSFDLCSNESFFELAEAHQLFANINYAIGLPEQYKVAIDSMWKYRSKLNKEIYFVEYAAYKMRYMTYFHNYTPAIKLADSASEVLSRNKFDSHLIDTLFFHANVLNTYRNTFLEDLSNSEKQMRKWTLFKKYEKFSWLSVKDEFQKAVYCTFLGNIMQDFVIHRPLQYPKEISDTAFKKALYYYKEGRRAILRKFGRENHLSGRLASLIALQFAKNKYQIDSVLYWCGKAISASRIQTMKRSKLYRHLKYPLFASRLKAAILIKDSSTVAAQLRTQIKEIESMLSHRSYYVGKFLLNRNDRFAQGYALDPADELCLLYRLSLKSANSKKDSLNYFNQIWNYQSVRYNKASYFEALQNHLGKHKVDQFISKYNLIYEQKQVLYDELYLARINNDIIDTTEVKREIEHWHNKLKNFLGGSPNEFKNFIENKSQQTINEFQNSLLNNEAFILFYYSNGMLSITQNKPFALIISYSNIEIANLKERDETIDFVLSISQIKNGSEFKRQAYTQYYNFFKEIDQRLDSSIESITLSVTPRLSNISFESTLRDTIFQDWEYAPFLLKELAISYTQNQSLDYLNSFRTFSSKRSLYQDNCNSTQLVAIPFSQSLSKALMNNYNFNNLPSASQFLADSSLLAFQLISHASLDSLLKVKSNYYKAQSIYDENSILLCDTILDLSDFDENNFKAKLAVIAACESGDGLIEQFNGRYDFGRVMLKNGSQTAVTSLIKMDDKSTAQILNNFYAYLAKGEKVPIALQKAKLDFLAQIEDPELYKPVYWAGLKVDGINQSIALTTDKTEVVDWILLGLIIAVFILFGLAYYKNFL